MFLKKTVLISTYHLKEDSVMVTDLSLFVKLLFV